VGGDATVSGGTGELLACDEWNMLSFRALIGLGKTEIYYEYGIFILLG